jgi:hypothetical protein
MFIFYQIVLFFLMNTMQQKFWNWNNTRIRFFWVTPHTCTVYKITTNTHITFTAFHHAFCTHAFTFNTCCLTIPCSAKISHSLSNKTCFVFGTHYYSHLNLFQTSFFAAYFTHFLSCYNLPETEPFPVQQKLAILFQTKLIRDGNWPQIRGNENKIRLK